MKKLLLILALLAFGILGLGTQVFAADTGVTLSVDYASMSVADLFDSKMFVLQVNYDGAGVFGFTYASAFDYDPDADGLDNNYYSLYGGYDFVEDESLMFAVIAGYADWSLTTTTQELSITSLGLGFRTGASFDKGSVYLTYIYGISNEIDTGLSSGDDFNAYLLELKGSYFFTDTFGMDFAYRTYQAEDFDVSGYAFGAIFKF